MLYSAEGLSLRDMSEFCCQAEAGLGLNRAFPLSPEFIVIHNGIITNYKDLQKFLVSDPWGVRPSLFSHSPLLSHLSQLTPPLVFSLLFPVYIPCLPCSFTHVAPLTLHSSLTVISHSHYLSPPFMLLHSYFCTPPIFTLPLLPLHSQTPIV